jgi:pimeloyl-ACP methyl ester carboxylesterase
MGWRKLRHGFEGFVLLTKRNKINMYYSIMRRFILSFLLLFVLGIYNPVYANEDAADNYVVLLHGIGMSKYHMQRLESYLEKDGLKVINIDYPSRKHSIEELTKFVHDSIHQHLQKAKTVHFVGHSMGGLVIREYIYSYKPANLGRVVHIGTPNKGSDIADKWQHYQVYRDFFGPAGQQLTSAALKQAPDLGKVTYEIGVIAGSRSIDPFSSWIIPGRDDGKVSIKNTMIEGMVDHIIVPIAHSAMPLSKLVHYQTGYFLKNGSFDHNKSEQELVDPKNRDDVL